jgi:hypothetical protein
MSAAGAAAGAAADATALRGDPESRKFTVVYLRDGKPIAFDYGHLTKAGSHLLASKLIRLD